MKEDAKEPIVFVCDCVFVSFFFEPEKLRPD